MEKIMSRSIAVTLLALAVSVSASAAEITIRDGKTQPENLTVTPEGHVIAGSYTSSGRVRAPQRPLST
jgi:hypothetical protein